MRKIFTFLFAALMSVGMWAEPITVTITNQDFPSEGNSFTKDGVTVSAETMSANYIADGTFSTTLGNITRIQVTSDARDASGDGWVGSGKTWVGNASSVSFSGYYSDMHGSIGIKFVITIEPASTPEPEPGTTYNVTFTQNSNVKVVENITLPHTFSCNFNDQNGVPASPKALKKDVRT